MKSKLQIASIELIHLVIDIDQAKLNNSTKRLHQY